MRYDIYINGRNARTTWGLYMDGDTLAALLTPSGNKTLVENDSRLANGKEVIPKHQRVADRDITLTLQLVADDDADFFRKYGDFCNELARGTLDITTDHQPGVVYHTQYISCTQFTQFNRGIAKFSLKLNEADPTNRQ